MGCFLQRLYQAGIKQAYTKQQEEYANLEKWEHGKLSASDRRVLITHWVAKAGKEWQAAKRVITVQRGFETTGANMTMDESQDHKITLAGRRTTTFNYVCCVLCVVCEIRLN